MNDRFKHLEKQASDYYWSLDDGERTADAFTKKFAELIVKECSDIAEMTATGEPTYGWMVANNIKQHFGVEE